MGTEPDPRFSLANERTFLAWIRTALGLLASAVVLEAVRLPVPGYLTTTAAVVLTTAAGVAAWAGWRGWYRTERALRMNRALPSNAHHALTLALAVGICMVMLLAVIVA
ncbi:YidH family protein [Tsukamurella ocularis]|uniref:YidH family protein n=1 Tax=Tsukamurella ocularis TaxID=1970234 RepID=UPI0039EFFE98